MHLNYFDENKHSPENPHFFIGGLSIPDAKALEFEETLAGIAQDFFGSRALSIENELHGKDLFHGKGNAKGRRLEERMRVFQAVAEFIVTSRIPVRMICIDVPRHNRRYKDPMPPYRLGLMLILEHISTGWTTWGWCSATTRPTR